MTGQTVIAEQAHVRVPCDTGVPSEDHGVQGNAGVVLVGEVCCQPEEIPLGRKHAASAGDQPGSRPQNASPLKGDAPGARASMVGQTHRSEVPGVIVVLASSGREPPPPALSEPYVTVSRHTAPTVRRVGEVRRCQWAKSFGCRSRAASSQRHARSGCPRSRLNFCIAHRTRCSSMRAAMAYNSER